MHLINLLRSTVNKITTASSRSPEWAAVEKQFLINNNKCACCHSTRHLQVHHKLPFHLHPSLELDTSNLVTLCMDNDCHLLIGHGDDFKAYNPNIDSCISSIAANVWTLVDAAAVAKSMRKYE